MAEHINVNKEEHICVIQNQPLAVDEEGYIYEPKRCMACGEQERNYNLKLK